MRSPCVGGVAHRDRDRGRPEFGRVRDESGNILVLFAVLLPLFLFCCAIVIDVGYWWANGKRAQVAADSCALAAASKLPFSYPDDPECVITGTLASPNNPDYIFANLPGHTGEGGKANEPRWLNTLVTSPYHPEGAPNPDDSYVRARVTIAVRTFFGRIIGKRVVRITRQAVAEAAPGDLAIFAKDTNCGSEGVWLNNGPMDINGGVWSNGDFKANGNDIDAESADVGGPNNCQPSPPYSPSCTGCEFGGSANPSVHNTDAEWPIWFDEASFLSNCDVVVNGDTLKIEKPGPYVYPGTNEIKPAVYCSDKEIQVTADDLYGNVTFATPILGLSKRHTFTAREQGVVVFGTGAQGKLLINTDDSTFNGIIFNAGGAGEFGSPPCPSPDKGRVHLNGKNIKVVGMLVGCTVRIDGEGFSITGDGGQRVVALYE